MSYTVEQSRLSDCLSIRIVGDWPEDDPKRIALAIYDVWKQNEALPVLIDVRQMRSAPSVFTDYDDAHSFIEAGFREMGRIAILDLSERRESDDFLETVAVNRGLHFKFFYGSEHEATSWLSPGGVGSA